MKTKHERIITLLEKYNLDGLLIQQVSNFAWATNGAASYINTASSYGVGTLLVMRNSRHLITDNIEAPRFDQEENLKESGWEFHVGKWYKTSNAIEHLTNGLELGADFAYPGAIDLSDELAVTRSYLDKDEQNRFRSLSTLCADSMNSTIRGIRPGITEFQIASNLAATAQSRGVQPIVNLIATDERIYNFRHPLPADKVMDKYAMLVLCGRQKGLVCSITRLVHFGQLPDELKEKTGAVAYIDAAMIAAARPGRTVAEIFATAIKAYAEVGFPDEYQLHHQGGPAGYDPREFIATPDTDAVIAVGQAYAWNPSITGCKSEDTILIGEEGNEILTTIDGWPSIPVIINGVIIDRPAILIVD